MRTMHNAETMKGSDMTIRLLPHWFPGRRRFVVWGRGLPHILSFRAALALMEGKMLQEFQMAGDPESVLVPYLSRVDRVLQGETVPATFGERVTIHADPLDDRQIRWISSAQDQHAHRWVCLLLTFAIPPAPSFVDMMTLTLQMAANGSLSTGEEQQRILALIDANDE